MSDDVLELRIYSDENPLLAVEKADPLLAVLEAAGELAPTTLRVKTGSRRYTRDEAKEELAKRRKERKQDLYLGGEAGLMVHLSAWAKNDHPSSRLTLTLPWARFADPEHVQERSRALVSLAVELAAVYLPRLGWAHSREDAQLSGDPTFIDPFVPLQLHQVYWLNLLGPALAKKLGRSRVLSTPAERVAELPHGAVLLLTQPSAGALFGDLARQAQAQALAHLRPDLAFDAVLAGLRARSAKLEHVERHWDPDLAHLFQKVIDHSPLGERRQREHELAGLHFEVSAWRPADEALPADVDDLDATLARYSVDGERFVLGMQEQIQGLDESPDSLPAVDLHFYHEDYPSKREQSTVEQLLLPTLGAWLGKLLVQHLDGRWLPRKALDESQVVVGGRAWLPFRQVQLYLGSQRAVLEYSLLKFYREAERHAHAPEPVNKNETQGVHFL